LAARALPAYLSGKLGALRQEEGCVSKFLILLGILLIIVGILWSFLGKLGLGRLPGDIIIERDNVHVYIPLATSILISIVLSAVLSILFWFLNR
jgi:uncharacterized membrane protein